MLFLMDVQYHHVIIKVKVGSKKINKKYVKKYKKIFTKKITGKKVKVTR